MITRVVHHFVGGSFRSRGMDARLNPTSGQSSNKSPCVRGSPGGGKANIGHSAAGRSWAVGNGVATFTARADLPSGRGMLHGAQISSFKYGSLGNGVSANVGGVARNADCNNSTAASAALRLRAKARR